MGRESINIITPGYRVLPPKKRPMPSVALEAEGLRLHLSPTSSTGYKGVYKVRGRKKYVAIRGVYLGAFDTAVEAAVAYARAVGEAPGEEPEAPIAAPPEAAPAAEGNRKKKRSTSDSGSSKRAKGASPEVEAESEGLRLHLSGTSSSGYRGVSHAKAGAQRRFRAYRASGGRQVSLGLFDTAVEAAVAYARAVGEAPLPSSLAAALPPSTAVGTRVEGRYVLADGRASWYGASVAEVHDGGAFFTLDWEDGDPAQRRQPKEHVRFPRASALQAPTPAASALAVEEGEDVAAWARLVQRRAGAAAGGFSPRVPSTGSARGKAVARASEDVAAPGTAGSASLRAFGLLPSACAGCVCAGRMSPAATPSSSSPSS